MTRRERMERRAARRLEWAEARRQKAKPLLAYTDRYRGDHAFNTQPGHIPERARVIRAEDKAFEHHQVADYHEQKADGISRQLDRTIFSDDPDAVERLQARIADLEATRELRKRANTAYKRGGIEAVRVACGDAMALEGATTLRVQPYYGKPFPAYSITNIGANIRRLQQRLAVAQARANTTEYDEPAHTGADR